MLLTIESHYSLGRSTLSPEKISKWASKNQYNTIGIADRNSTASFYEFSEVSKKYNIKTILGACLNARYENHEGYVTFFARNNDALPNLYKLTTLSNEKPIVINDIAKFYHKDLFMITGNSEDGLLPTLSPALMHLFLEDIEKTKINYAIEIHRNTGASASEANILRAIHKSKINRAIIATSSARNIDQEDRQSLEVIKHISDKQSKIHNAPPLSQNLHLKNEENLLKLFADIPQSIENAKRLCNAANAAVVKEKPRLPHFPGLNLETEKSTLIKNAEAGLTSRASNNEAIYKEIELYKNRLDYELGHICRLGYSGYFLIVADFINWAKSNNIPVGPGRGSGAGSLVAYSLGITELDPIRFGLLFERFINPDRVSLPDFDIDICQKRRDEVIAYVANHYGRDRVAQIGAYSLRQPKAAFRDAATANGITPGAAEAFTKKIPANLKILQDALTIPEINKSLNQDPELKIAFTAAEKLVNIISHRTRHPAGIIIADRPLTETTSLYPPESGQTIQITHYEMHSAEDTGHVKFDFLGLKTLTIIQNTVSFIKKRGIDINPYAIPLHDPDVFNMINKGMTRRIFQIESPGMGKAIKEISPTRFEDLIALLALYRPGPMEYIPLYGGRKKGTIPTEYPHPALEDTLSETHGIIIYQEQIMEMARKVAGYSLGEADILRRAIGKKKPEDIAAQRIIFIQKCIEQGETVSDAEKLYDFVIPFASYGFNKSHAAAYTLISWITAWLKYHYPAEFMASNMIQEIGETEALEQTIQESRKIGCSVLPPDINLSDHSFIPNEDKTIRYALSALKGMPNEIAEQFIHCRQNTTFKSLEDTLRKYIKYTGRSPGNKAMEILISSGAFDNIPVFEDKPLDKEDKYKVRGLHLSNYPQIINAIQKVEIEGQNSLFGASSKEVESHNKTKYSHAEAIAAEEAAFGFRFANHPIDEFLELIDGKKVLSLKQIQEISKTISKNGSTSHFGVLCELSAASEQDEQIVAFLSDKDKKIAVRFIQDLLPPRKLPSIIIANLDFQNFPPILTSYKLAQDHSSRPDTSLVIQFTSQKILQENMPVLRNLLKSHKGNHTVFLGTNQKDTKELSAKINNDSHLIEKISKIDGIAFANFTEDINKCLTLQDKLRKEDKYIIRIHKTQNPEIIEHIAQIIPQKPYPAGNSSIDFIVETEDNKEIYINAGIKRIMLSHDIISNIQSLSGITVQKSS